MPCCNQEWLIDSFHLETYHSSRRRPKKAIGHQVENQHHQMNLLLCKQTLQIRFLAENWPISWFVPLHWPILFILLERVDLNCETSPGIAAKSTWSSFQVSLEKITSSHKKYGEAGWFQSPSLLHLPHIPSSYSIGCSATRKSARLTSLQFWTENFF